MVVQSTKNIFKYPLSPPSLKFDLFFISSLYSSSSLQVLLLSHVHGHELRLKIYGIKRLDSFSYAIFLLYFLFVKK